MTDQSVFKAEPVSNQDTSQNQPSAETAPKTPSYESELKAMLSLITNDKGEPKYKDVPDAIKGLYHSQQYISTLQREKQEQAMEYERVKKELEEIQRIKDVLGDTSSTQALPPAKPGIDEKEVVGLVHQAIASTREQEVRAKNVTEISEEVRREYGEKAKDFLTSKSAELGLTFEEMELIAATKPKAAREMLGLGKKKSAVNPTVGGRLSEIALPKEENYIGPNTESVLYGASRDQLVEEYARAAKAAKQLQASGYSTYDLADPKVYFKVMKGK